MGSRSNSRSSAESEGGRKRSRSKSEGRKRSSSGDRRRKRSNSGDRGRKRSNSGDGGRKRSNSRDRGRKRSNSRDRGRKRSNSGDRGRKRGRSESSSGSHSDGRPGGSGTTRRARDVEKKKAKRSRSSDNEDNEAPPRKQRKRGANSVFSRLKFTDRGRRSDKRAGKGGMQAMERTEVFEIRVGGDASAEEFSAEHEDGELLEVVSPERMSGSHYCTSEDVLELWAQKNRMDDLFDAKLGYVYYEERDTMFPLDKKGSDNFWNRAGDKLYQCHEGIDLFEGVPRPIVFLDVCGGPGAFSQVLLKNAPDGDDGTKPRGYGITIQVHDTDTSECWYPQLENNPRWEALFGVDNTGDVYNPANLRDVQAKVGEVSMVVGDGGFKITTDDKGDHMENYQELFSGRIFLSEVLVTFMTIKEGGSFCCKLFDSFSELTASIIYAVGAAFEKCYIVKPERSRVCNSERYLCGKGFKSRSSSTFLRLLNALQVTHRNCEKSRSPRSVIPLKILHADAEFVRTMTEANEVIVRKQIKALSAIMDSVDSRRARGDTGRRRRKSTQKMSTGRSERDGNSYGYKHEHLSRGSRR